MNKLKRSKILPDVAEKRLRELDYLFRSGKAFKKAKIVFKGKLNPSP